MESLVSILVPIYKIPEHFLRRCIESLINQTLKDIEIILVDDGSPDNCGGVCDEYAASDSRIKVIHKENGGLAAARNSAFDIATSECVMFVDGDDFLDVRTCEVVYKELVEKNVDVVLFNQTTEYHNSQQVVDSIGSEPLLYKGEQCKELQVRVLDFNGKIAQVFCKLIKKSLLDEYNIKHVDSLKQGAEGFVFNIALFEHVKSAYYLPVPFYHYIYNEQSISHTPSEENYYFIIRCFEYIKDFVSQSANKTELIRYLYNRILYVIVTTAITGYFNPYNTASFSQKVRGFKNFLKEPLVNHSLYNADYFGLSMQRKLILSAIKLHQWWILVLLGKMRRKQLGNK